MSAQNKTYNALHLQTTPVIILASARMPPYARFKLAQTLGNIEQDLDFMRAIRFAPLIGALLIVIVPAMGERLPDSANLKEIYDADQEARSPENVQAGIAPTLQQERDRRFAVLQLISEGELRSAADFFRAGIVLHHTGSIRFEDGRLVSLGTESKLLAFFLFRRSDELGHKSGRNMMAAAYNYYLNACGEDGGKFGYDFIDGQPVWRPDLSEKETEELKCGFDPRPYFE